MVGSRDAIFEHCGDDEAEQRWEDLCDQFDRTERMMAQYQGRDTQPPTDRQRYAMRVSWQETERHMRLRKKVKKQWDVQNPPTEGDDIMDAARKAESPAIKEAGLPSGVAEAVVDPRLMPPQEMVRQWAEQTEPLREGASINEVQPTPADQVFGLSRREAEEEHGLGRFKQGMQTPDVVRDRSVKHAEQHVLINREETVQESMVECTCRCTRQSRGPHVHEGEAMSNARCTECGVVDYKGKITHAETCSQPWTPEYRTFDAVRDSDLDNHFYDAKAMTLEESPGFFSDTLEPVNTKEYWSTLQVSAMLGCVAFGACLALGVMYAARVGVL